MDEHMIDSVPLTFINFFSPPFLNGDISSLATKWWETWRREKIPNIVMCSPTKKITKFTISDGLTKVRRDIGVLKYETWMHEKKHDQFIMIWYAPIDCHFGFV